MAVGIFQLDLLGPFYLTDPNGVRIVITSKRSRAILAMLATSRLGARSRRWLQERLWGSRDRTNAQASLRRELSTLRSLVNPDYLELLIVERDTVLLRLDIISIDIKDPVKIVQSREDFLEGIDIAGEEGFEDWLREERQSISARREAHKPGKNIEPTNRSSWEDNSAG